MPAKKKNNPTIRRIIIWGVVLAVVALMVVSFSAPQNITEIVVYP